MRFALFLIAVTSLRAQGSPLKTSPTDYPAHIQLDNVTLAAEYLVQSLPTSSGSLVAHDYLVVQAAFFGPAQSRLQISASQFSLRINGRGLPIPTELPGIVAGSINSFGNDRVPSSTSGPLVPQEQGESVEHRVQSVSLAEGQRSLPSVGIIFFPYRGKLKSIHSLELLYNGSMGKATLKLLP
jgi:hypothetical protein